MLNALLFAAIGFHSKDSPFFIVAINFCPKLSNDHDAGSSTTVDDNDATPQPRNTSTEDPLLCADLVPATALVIPVKLLPFSPVYEINSAPTLIVPVVGKLVVPAKVIEVPVPPVPAVSSCRAPFNVLITPEDPPHPDVP